MISGPYTLGGEATGMAGVGQGVSASKNPQVLEELEILEKVVAEAGGAIQVLSDRLTGVITQESPSSNKEARVEASLVPVAAFIKTQREGVCFILYKINSILHRLEL